MLNFVGLCVRLFVLIGELVGFIFLCFCLLFSFFYVEIIGMILYEENNYVY